jgi:hypothetical protein
MFSDLKDGELELDLFGELEPEAQEATDSLSEKTEEVLKLVPLIFLTK